MRNVVFLLLRQFFLEASLLFCLFVLFFLRLRCPAHGRWCPQLFLLPRRRLWGKGDNPQVCRRKRCIFVFQHRRKRRVPHGSAVERSLLCRNVRKTLCRSLSFLSVRCPLGKVASRFLCSKPRSASIA